MSEETTNTSSEQDKSAAGSKAAKKAEPKAAAEAKPKASATKKADTKPAEKEAAAEPKTDAAATTTESKPAGGASTGDQYAIVEASGTQLWLQPNRYYDVDRLSAEVGSEVTFGEVLLVSGSTGTTLGKPYVKEASVSLKVLAHRRGPKVIVYKMRKKKKTRRKNGHRQELTRVMVESITIGGKPLS
jgi:large subunit ribosomal protein L21